MGDASEEPDALLYAFLFAFLFTGGLWGTLLEWAPALREGELVGVVFALVLGPVGAVAAVFSLLDQWGPVAFTLTALWSGLCASTAAGHIVVRTESATRRSAFRQVRNLCWLCAPIAGWFGYPYLHEALAAWWQWFFGLLR